MTSVDSQAMIPLWRRAGARLLDFGFWLLIWYGIESTFLIPPQEHSLLVFLFDQILAALAMILTEPLWLSLFGRSPGKAVLGLCLFHRDGRRLTLGEAGQRTFVMWKEGLGFGIPFYRAVTLGRIFQARGDLPFPWEGESVVASIFGDKPA